MWSELVANSSRWLSTDVRTSAPLKNSWAHATLSTNVGGGTACQVVRVLVIAKDEPNAASMMDDIAVTVSVPRTVLSKPPAQATLLHLTAPALSSRTDVDWAGQSWGSRNWNSTDGRPMGARTANMVAAHASGVYSFAIAQLSAAILVVEDCSDAYR